ncbi:MAG: DNA polymerase III subunit gamma/tau [Bacteroidales bacterium]
MESFVVSARKYRPNTFDTVIGQKSITGTLKNAIKNDHLAQSFLFCGPRGVGKTTCARILAKTINCENLSENIEACNECDSCKSFNESTSFNVHELDAASNNSVDDIRALVDQVRIPPQLGRYKVYIIDEVHMLSTQAFNAFLKTLEEPPSYAKFILATTEKHKIIPTILSRCQIYDFARITVDDIASHIQFVAKSENVKIEEEAAHIIAQKADGALRDALSIFDQIVSFAGDEITYDLVIENLNVLDYDYYFKMTAHILEANTSEVLLLLDEIISKGFEGSHFILGFGEHLRNLLVCKNPETVKLIEVSDSIRQKYLQQCNNCPEGFLLDALTILNQCDIDYKTATNKRLRLELSLLQIASLHNSSDTEKKKIVKKDYKISSPKDQKKEDKTAKTDAVESSAPDTESKEQPAIKPEHEKEDSPKPASPKSSRSFSISIKDDNDDDKKKNEECSIVSEDEMPVDDFSEQEFKTAWKKLAEIYKDVSPTIYIALTKSPLTLKGTTVQLLIDNPIQLSSWRFKGSGLKVRTERLFWMASSTDVSPFLLGLGNWVCSTDWVIGCCDSSTVSVVFFCDLSVFIL